MGVVPLFYLGRSCECVQQSAVVPPPIPVFGGASAQLKLKPAREMRGARIMFAEMAGSSAFNFAFFFAFSRAFAGHISMTQNECHYLKTLKSRE
jgi:hypothetical protein